MRLSSLLCCSALIAATSLTCRSAVAAPPAGEVVAFSPANSIPGTLSLTASSIARMQMHLLPSLATAHLVHLNMHLPAAVSPARATSVAGPKLPDSPSMEGMIDSIPVGERMRRIGRTHINTSDASMKNDFALCYRMNKRWGFQMIPGDPTPVKAPVASFRDADGVIVGLVMRLRTRS